MSKQANPKVIGGFVMGAVILSVAAVLVFGSGQLLSEKVEFVLFFEGSMAGLNVGSPVMFRGVKIGSVTDIVVRHDVRDHTITLPVYIELEPGRVEVFGDPDKPRDPLGVMQFLVEEKGLRAQLATSSFVTGQRVVEFQFHPEEPKNLTGGDPRYPELPTMDSPFADFAKTIQNLPIEPLVNDMRHTVQGIDELVRAPEIMKTIRDLDETLLSLQELARNVNSRIEPLTDAAQAALNQAKESVASVEGRLNEALGDVQQLAKNVDERIGPLATSLQDTLEVARSALEQAEGTLASIQTVVAEDSPLYHQVSDALGELSAALDAVRVLAEYLQQHPEAVFSGKTSTGGK